ncbi:auxin transporter-like protein 1 [Nymphaea colorata]|nr:auxin transporter-like protein 1 [Nymphaea colorata]
MVWHGGSVYDAWLNAVAAQVGSLVLTLPYTFSQMGYVYGVASHFLYGAFGCWAVYLLGLFHAEASRRTWDIGIIHKRHILEYHEVIEVVSGKWLGGSVLFFNMAALTFACINQLIACSSEVT